MRNHPEESLSSIDDLWLQPRLHFFRRRGHECIMDYRTGERYYIDDRQPLGAASSSDRNCLRCNEPPTVDGHDTCLSSIEGASSACCGHGFEAGYASIVGKRLSLCVNCRWRPPVSRVNFRCRACHRYVMAHGRERPESMVIESIRRFMLSEERDSSLVAIGRARLANTRLRSAERLPPP